MVVIAIKLSLQVSKNWRAVADNNKEWELCVKRKFHVEIDSIANWKEYYMRRMRLIKKVKLYIVTSFPGDYKQTYVLIVCQMPDKGDRIPITTK